MEGNEPYQFNATVRSLPSTGAIPSVTQMCEFYDGDSCSGTSLGQTHSDQDVTTAGLWLPFSADFLTPAGTISGLCDVAVNGGDEGDVQLDEIFLG